jgi:cysteinyl-tRNA synthetase
MKFRFVIASISVFFLSSLIAISSSLVHVSLSLFRNNFIQSKGVRLPTIVNESASRDDNDGWFDDYDNFVSKLNFKEWDNEVTTRTKIEKRVSLDNRRSSSVDYKNIRNRGGPISRGHDFSRSPDDDLSRDVDVEAIDSLLAERIACKRRSDFSTADKIRERLLEDHGVVLWDKEKIWTTNRNSKGGSARHRGNGRYAGGASRRTDTRKTLPRNQQFQIQRDFGPNGHDYTQTGGPIDPDLCTLQEEQINEFLALRLKYKMSRKFDEADQVKDNLYKNGVSIHDGFKQWRADGVDWDKKEKQRGKREYTHRKRAGDPSLSQDQMDEIMGQVILRADAKRAADFILADSIKSYLAERYSVIIDDSHYEWSFMSDSYSLSVTSYPLPEKDGIKDLIEEKIIDRAKAKSDKIYHVADAIREELFQVFNVTIDDRLKEYTYHPPLVADTFRTEETRVTNDGSEQAALQAFYQKPAEVSTAPMECIGDPSNHEKELSNNIVDRSDLEALTVPELKEMLRRVGLPISGRKDSLIERLLNNLS